MFGILTKAKNYIYEKRRIRNALSFTKAIVQEDSYFPEHTRKTEKQRLQENKLWAQKYEEPNKFYNLYGFDLVNSNSEDYIDYLSFRNTREELNKVTKPNSEVCLLRDKFLFYKYMKSNNLPVPEVFGVVRNGELFDIKMNNVSFDAISDEKDFFIKDIDGECASFVKKISNSNELEELLPKIPGGGYILQRKVKQKAEMSAIYPHAVNTLRVVTINIDSHPYVLTSLLRVGTSRSGNVDNWAAGGLAIGIQDSGYLKKYGFYKPEHGRKTEKHPDTNVVFKNFAIPNLEEAYEIAIKAHKCFYGIPAIGWDIAITENGPCFIEGNDNWEISLMQACDRPLKQEWLDIIDKAK